MTNPQIASDGMRYQGHAYLYGGAPGSSGSQPWDCSSFVNWVIGHDLGGAIPGYKAGAYTGAVHGPPTTSWLTSGLCSTISKANAQPGDLVVWQTHMGIYTGGGNMISALDEALGTRVTTVSGGAPGGEVAFYKRYNAALGSTATTTSAVTTSSSGGSSGTSYPYPLGLLDPLNWGASISQTTEQGLEKTFGEVWDDLVPKLKDWGIRIGLVILGVIILYAGLRSITGMRASSVIQVVAPESAAAQGIAKGTSAVRQARRPPQATTGLSKGTRRQPKSSGGFKEAISPLDEDLTTP